MKKMNYIGAIVKAPYCSVDRITSTNIICGYRSMLTGLPSFRTILNRLRRLLPFRDDPSNPAIFLTGSGRSGTTWVAEMLHHHTDCRIMFEPFKPTVSPEMARLKNRMYLRPGQNAVEAEKLIERVLSGNYRHKWVDQYNNQFKYKLRLVKEIRFNLMVGWILDQHPSVRCVHLIRNPFDTVASQLRGEWQLGTDMFLNQEALVKDYLEPFLDILSKAEGPKQLGLAQWAIENFVPIQQSKQSKKIELVFYDRLRNEDAYVGSFLDSFGVADIDWKAIRKKSRMTRKAAPKSKLSYLPEDIEYGLELFDTMGIAEFFDFDNTVRKGADSVIM